MRRSGLALAGILLMVAPASAQKLAPPQIPSSPPPAPTPADPNLDKYLLKWEFAMQQVKTLRTQFTRTDDDKTFGTVKKFTGYASYMKDGAGASVRNLAQLEFRPIGSNEFSEKYLCTGTFWYVFFPSQKQITAFEMPKPRPGAASSDNFLGMLLGMKAEEAKRRYQLKLIKEDNYYIYVEVLPRFPGDREDFQQARIVLNKDSYLPRQLWFKQPNKNETTWDIPQILLNANAKVDQREFDKPATPPGWKLVLNPPAADATPKVYRNSGAP